MVDCGCGKCNLKYICSALKLIIGGILNRFYATRGEPSLRKSIIVPLSSELAPSTGIASFCCLALLLFSSSRYEAIFQTELPAPRRILIYRSLALYFYADDPFLLAPQTSQPPTHSRPMEEDCINTNLAVVNIPFNWLTAVI